MASYREAIRDAEKKLQHIDKPQLAKLFMLELTRQRQIDLYMEYESAVSEGLLEIYQQGIERILHDEPMQYVLGYEWFYGYQFMVNPSVLIPRPETEELVANVLVLIDERKSEKANLTLIDVGCGSGAIGISLKLEESTLRVLASDISEDAIYVAKQNALKLNADISFYVGSMLEPLIDRNEKVDIIVCNPPYIPAQEHLEATVKDYEPNVALFGGNNGLYFYRMVFDHCQDVLNPGGLMAFEIGYDQKEALLAEVKNRFPKAHAEVIVDMYGKDRILIVDFARET